MARKRGRTSFSFQTRLSPGGASTLPPPHTPLLSSLTSQRPLSEEGWKRDSQRGGGPESTGRPNPSPRPWAYRSWRGRRPAAVRPGPACRFRASPPAGRPAGPRAPLPAPPRAPRRPRFTRDPGSSAPASLLSLRVGGAQRPLPDPGPPHPTNPSPYSVPPAVRRPLTLWPPPPPSLPAPLAAPAQSAAAAAAAPPRPSLSPASFPLPSLPTPAPPLPARAVSRQPP